MKSEERWNKKKTTNKKQKEDRRDANAHTIIYMRDCYYPGAPHCVLAPPRPIRSPIESAHRPLYIPIYSISIPGSMGNIVYFHLSVCICVFGYETSLCSFTSSPSHRYWLNLYTSSVSATAEELQFYYCIVLHENLLRFFSFSSSLQSYSVADTAARFSVSLSSPSPTRIPQALPTHFPPSFIHYILRNWDLASSPDAKPEVKLVDTEVSVQSPSLIATSYFSRSHKSHRPQLLS